jgi:asparagine synthase (glutamine-hydrolysing)
MCGIWAFIQGCQESRGANPISIAQALQTLLARGPETAQYRVYNIGTDTGNSHSPEKLGLPAYLGFTRLAINGLTPDGDQPMTEMESSGGQPRVAWVCNGEIYNWEALKENMGLYPTQPSASDCSMLGALWLRLRDEPDGPKRFFRALDGVFAIVLLDLERGTVLVGRDPYGVRPLFMASRDSSLSTYFGSEVKTIYPFTSDASTLTIEQFPAGHYAFYKQGTPINSSSSSLIYRPLWSPQSYHEVPWLKMSGLVHDVTIKEMLRNSLVSAVRKRMMTERPVAALLSGGVDSSLIAALVAREMRQSNSKQRLQTFSIGFQGSSDLYYARLVAEKIGSEHHEIVSTPDEFFAAIPEVIRAIESYDITTVRASVGNYLVSKAIRTMTSCKVVFNGDGSDEVFGSYLYFYRAPTDEDYESETIRLLKDIAYFDVLRSDRSISSHGLEARTPFLDKQFVNLVKALPTSLCRPTKTQKEKNILRQAFEKDDLLPTEVLWRRKEAFSDGVSGLEKAWYQEIAERLQTEGLIPSDWQDRAKKFCHLPPKTPEAYYYRVLYEKNYGQYNAEKAVPYFWMPRWSGETVDPSARTLSFY